MVFWELYEHTAIRICLGLLVHLIFRNTFPFILNIVFYLVWDGLGSGKWRKIFLCKCILVWMMVFPIFACRCTKSPDKELWSSRYKGRWILILLNLDWPVQAISSQILFRVKRIDPCASTWLCNCPYLLWHLNIKINSFCVERFFCALNMWMLPFAKWKGQMVNFLECFLCVKTGTARPWSWLCLWKAPQYQCNYLIS